jgi:similar to stage IV sporulation protein
MNVAELPVAKGFVRGRTWYSAEVTVPLRETIISETGQQRNGWGIKAGEGVIMITRAQSPFPEVQVESSQFRLLSWRNWQFPVEIIKMNYREMKAESVSRTTEQALQAAEEQARRELAANLPENADVLRQDIVVMPSEEGFIRVRVQAEVFEDLAVYIDG